MLIMSLLPLQAQNQPSEKLADFVDKKLYKKGILLAPAHRLKSKNNTAPKTIGLLVFGVHSSPEYTGSDGFWSYYESMSDVSTHMVAQKVHDQCIDGLKANFKEQGVTLLTPAEYLDTDAKKTAYQNMDMRMMGLAAATAQVANPDQIGLPAGYKYIKNSIYHSDVGGRADLIEPLKTFDLDGYLCVFLEFYGAETLSNVRTNLMLFKDRDYVSKVKKETYRRMDLASNVLPMGNTQIETAARNELKAMKKKKRDTMISLENGQMWVDPNIAKVIIGSTSYYFPLIK